MAVGRAEGEGDRSFPATGTEWLGLPDARLVRRILARQSAMRPVTAQIRTILGSHSESGRVVVNENTGAGRDIDGSRPFSRSRPDGGRVSVVIPCYNQARFLGEAIQSVLCQGYPDLEIIVVDDGSEDSTEEVASGYTKKDPRVRLIRQDNKGLAAARNRGLSEAGGEYVVFLDSDDRLVLEALEVGVRELESHPGAFPGLLSRYSRGRDTPPRGEHDPRLHLDVEVQHGRTPLTAQTRKGGRALQGRLQSRGETLERLARRPCGQSSTNSPPRGEVVART